MRKMLSVALAVMLLPAVAFAEDLSAMSTAELVATRDAINQEIASRTMTEDAQTITVNGVIFKLMLVERGTADKGDPALCFILLATNTTDASFTPVYDMDITVTQGGKLLRSTAVKSEHLGSWSVYDSSFAPIAPGAVDMQVARGYILDGEGSHVDISLFKKKVGREDPYCGTFSIEIPNE